MSKSPFYVVEEFISPLMCEDIVDLVDFNIPDQDKEGRWLKTVKHSEVAEGMIYERLLLLLPELQGHFQLQYRGTESVDFEWFPEGSAGTFHAENSEFLRQKWVRTNARDLTAVLFLSDYQDQIPFEQEFDVYGGKLEFVQHQFGFNPRRGTLIVFPSDPHFINTTSQVFAGDLFQARFHIVAKTPYMYNPDNFPGNYTTWFSPYLNQPS